MGLVDGKCPCGGGCVIALTGGGHCDRSGIGEVSVPAVAVGIGEGVVCACTQGLTVQRHRHSGIFGGSVIGKRPAADLHLGVVQRGQSDGKFPTGRTGVVSTCLRGHSYGSLPSIDIIAGADAVLIAGDGLAAQRDNHIISGWGLRLASVGIGAVYFHCRVVQLGRSDGKVPRFCADIVACTGDSYGSIARIGVIRILNRIVGVLCKLRTVPCYTYLWGNGRIGIKILAVHRHGGIVQISLYRKPGAAGLRFQPHAAAIFDGNSIFSNRKAFLL